MDGKKLEILMTAVDLGSLSKASDAVGYTQSGLTHLFDSLEREIGLTLIWRGHRGISLTRAGEELMPYIREFLRANANLENRISAITEQRSETVRVAAYASIAMHWMPEILYRFRRVCPHIDVDLRTVDHELEPFELLEAWRTDVLRHYPFPVWKSEKFAPEQIVFNQIALDGYKIRWYPTAMAICEYQDDGLTKGSRKLEIQNPMGYAMMYNHKLKYDIPFAQKLRCAMQCTALSIVGRNPQYILQTNLPIAAIATLFPGVLLAIRRKWQYRCECL